MYVLMKVFLSIKEKLQLCFFAAFVMAYLFSWPVLYYSCPKYEIEPHLSLYLFIPTLVESTVVFMAFASLVWGCIEGVAWIMKKYQPLSFCSKLAKDILAMLYCDKWKHLILHVFLLIGNIPIQQAVNRVSVLLNSVTYSFSLSPALRIVNVFVCYLIMLLVAYIYLKVTRCNMRSLVHYAFIGILACPITALGIEWVELVGYENEFCSDYG